MTQATAAGPARAPRRAAGAMHRGDHAFLPAALELLETPPSPIRMSLLLLICGAAVMGLGWAAYGRLDIVAVAQGKLQPTGRVKVIQPLETSRVLLTRVDNGARVRAGEALVELDPGEAAADLAGAEADLASASAEVLRREGAIAAAAAPAAAPPALRWPPESPAAIRDREARVLAADVLSLRAQVDSLEAQRDEKLAEVTRLQAMIAAQTELIGTLQQRVAMRTTLLDMNAGTRATLLDATETLQSQKTALAQQRGQLAEAVASAAVIGRDIQRATHGFAADNAQKLAAAERQVGELTQRRAKAQARLEHMTLRSPIDGTVQASALTTVGQVVTSGQELMRVVPEGAALEVECYLPNRDIGFVRPGDRAIVKVESFPFTRYGTIDATVTRVARDAIPEPDADQIERGTARGLPSLSPAGAQRTQNLVFPVTLAPGRRSMDADGTAVSLGAGMAVTVEIRTGSRSILDYLFSPLARIGAEAMRER